MPCFWKEVKKKKVNKKKSNVIDGKSDDEEIISIFTGKFLLGISQVYDNNEDEALINNINHEWQNKRKFNLQISSDTVRKLSIKLSNGVGHDGIHPILFKKGSDEFLCYISSFINSCFSHCIFPTDLLRGDLNPTVKDLKGNFAESTNYRPVMNSSSLLKLIELHLLNILEEKIFFNPRQFGFQKGSSTTDACYLLKETVSHYVKGKGKAYAAFIDLSKAFDMVNHNILGHKLLERSVPPDIVLLIMNYLRNQSARVIWNNKKGNYFYINKGVKQGGILSPFLFKLYLDEIISEISKLDIGCKLGLMRINIIGYADDLVLISDSALNLSYLYSFLKKSIENLKLLINKNKSKCMIFRSGRLYQSHNFMILDGDQFEVVKNYKYLGHYINWNLDDEEDIKCRLNGFYGKFNSVYRNFNNVSIQTFLFLFNSYCCPEYGLSLWNVNYTQGKQIMKSFEIAYSNALKKIIGVPRYSSSHITADICDQLLLKHHIAFVQLRYIFRILESNNSIFRICSPMLKVGYLYSAVSNLFNNDYSVNIWLNDKDALKSRIFWVQKHEDRIRRCPFYSF